MSGVNLNLKINSPAIIVSGSVSAAASYALGVLLAGRSIFKVGALIAAGTNPALLALAALAGTAAFLVFCDCADSLHMKKNVYYTGGCVAAGIVIFKILSGNIIESSVVFVVSVVANRFLLSKPTFADYDYSCLEED